MPTEIAVLLPVAFLWGVRHGVDWDHIAAITDITSTTAAGDAATEIHVAVDQLHPHERGHAHGGRAELAEHSGAPQPVAVAAAHAAEPPHEHPHRHGSADTGSVVAPAITWWVWSSSGPRTARPSRIAP